MARAKPDASYQEYSQNLDQYSSKLPEEVLRDVRGILKKPILNRTQEDIHQLFFYFQKLEFFDDILQTYDMWTVLACLKLLSLVTLMPNQIVFQRDEISKCFWVLLNGEAMVNNSTKERDKMFKVGESAGNFEDQMMQFSLRTVMKCEFAMLRKEQYEFVVQKRDDNENKRIIKLLKNTTVFEDFQMVILKKNINNFIKRTYNYNSIVYDENQPIDGIYIIDSGQFSVMKSKLIDSTKQGKDQELPTNKAFVRISVLQQQSQVFGQEEIFRARNHRKNRVICSYNNSKVLFLNIEHYMEMFKSTSNKTISNLIEKEKNTQQMREGIIERRQQLDQHYKHFLYQSHLSPPHASFNNSFKYYDPETLAELSQLQVPSTKKNHYLPSINQNSRQQSLERNKSIHSESQQDVVQNKQEQFNFHNTNSKASINNQSIVDNHNNSNHMISIYVNNLSPENSKINLEKNEIFYHNKNNKSTIGQSSTIAIQNNSEYQTNENQKTKNISGSNQNISQTHIDDTFLEENDLLEIKQKQKMQNIQEILEKNKHLCQNANFINDEDVLQELQRNKQNNTTLNAILSKNRSNSIRRQSILEKNEGKTPGQLQKEKSFYEVDNENKGQIQRSNKFNKNSESKFKPKTRSNTNSKITQGDQTQISNFLITQQISDDQTTINTKNDNIPSQSNQQINTYLPQIGENNNSKRRRSLRQHLLADSVRKSQQNYSFHNIYEVSDQRYQQLSYKEQLSKLNKSEEIIPNMPKFNQIANSQRQYLSVYANPYSQNSSNDKKQQFLQYKDLNASRHSREMSLAQIYEDVSPEKIQNLNLDVIEFQISNQSELMRQAEHEIQYAITGTKNKLIENYIDKYIKRTKKRKLKDGFEIPSLLENLKKDNSMILNNSIELLNEYNSQVSSNINLGSENTQLPQLHQNNSNFKSFMGGIQPQNSINKQFLRKSRKKIKEKLQKAIEDKLFEDPSLIKKSPSLTQKPTKNNDNQSKQSILLSNPFISPKSIKNTPKLHTVILGIDKFDIVKD